MTRIRLLGPGDEPALEAFLVQYAETSMFLRSNLRRGGIADRGAPLQATYVAALDGARVVAAAAHAWNGVLLPQAPVHLDAVVREAVARTGRPVIGIMGPRTQVVRARTVLGRAATPTAVDEHEILLALDLTRLWVPRPLAEGDVVCRPTRPVDLALAAFWRATYRIETLGDRAGARLEARSREEIAQAHDAGCSWMLWEGETPVAYAAFNATLPDVVQVGGVFTPPERRRCGYGRAVVAGALLEARRDGVARAVLFTDEDNVPARRAYEALGFTRIGDYGLVFFDED